jgi:XTP/dITP diphosphohydrolase
VVLASPDGVELAAIGVVEGVIAAAPTGDAGFGYDPVFKPAGGGGRTFAEMTAEEKDAISHRGRALRSLAREMRDAMPTSIRPQEA